MTPFFSHVTHGFVIVIVCYCVNVLLLVNKFMKTNKIVLLSQFELKFYKDQKCHPVLWHLVHMAKYNTEFTENFVRPLAECDESQTDLMDTPFKWFLSN